MKEKQNEITGCVIEDWGQIDADWKSAWICLLKIGRRLTKIAQTRPCNRYSYSSCRPPLSSQALLVHRLSILAQPPPHQKREGGTESHAVF